MLTCQDVIGILMDYLDSAVTPEMARAMDEHLNDCPACVAYLNTYRKTRELTGQVLEEPMPDEMKTRLRRVLLDHLRGH